MTKSFHLWSLYVLQWSEVLLDVSGNTVYELKPYWLVVQFDWACYTVYKLKLNILFVECNWAW